jgi:hypothetical protein
MTHSFLSLLLALLACASDEAQHTHTSPRLLHSFSLEGLGTFSLYDSDPRPQAASFCSTHHMSISECDQLTADAEAYFFSQQWHLQSTEFELTLPTGETRSLVFDLYSGLGPVLQAHRFCEAHLLSPHDCAPIAEAARDTFYKTGRVLLEAPLELSSAQEVASTATATASASAVQFRLFDNLPPGEQALDTCLQHGIIAAAACGDIVALAEDAFHPLLASVPLPASFSVPVSVSVPAAGGQEEEEEGQEQQQQLELELLERQDPALAALAVCARHSLPAASPPCAQLLAAAEEAYFSALAEGGHLLREVFFLPGAGAGAGALECPLYEGLDPSWQALRCCDRHQVSRADCRPLEAAVQDMFYGGQSALASFSLQLSAPAEDGTTTAELQLYASLDPLTQLTSFCRKHGIMFVDCATYLEAAEAGYYEATGALLVPITLGKPIDAVFNLYDGFDPVVQAQRFCDKHHLLAPQCESLRAHAFEEYVSRGNELPSIPLAGEPELVLVVRDNLDPRLQADYFCEQHHLSRDTCGEVVTLAEHLYFGAGDLITSIPMTIRNTSLALKLYQNVDPLRQVRTFCDLHRILGSDCASLQAHAMEIFHQAGRLVDIVRMYMPSGTDGGGALAEQQLECYDNLDPETQARSWCARLALSPAACLSLVDVFETTFFQAGEVLGEVVFADQPFVLRDQFDPFVQASRFCRRNRISLISCQPLVEYAEQKYYKFGSVVSVFDLRGGGDGEEVLSFTLYDRADPATQVARFCERNKFFPNCEDLLKSAAEKRFFEAGKVLQDLTVQTSSATNDSFVFTLYSHLDPALQAERACAEHHLEGADCSALITTAEKEYFQAGAEIAYFTYQLEAKNITFVLYNGVDPVLQLARFFRRHRRVPAVDRAALTAAMTEKFYETGSRLATLNVTVEGEDAAVSLPVFDNLDPSLQAGHFCAAHTLSAAACVDITAAAEEAFFGVAAVDLFEFALDDRRYHFHYFSNVDLIKQVERFCLLHELSASSCESTALLAGEQLEAWRLRQKGGDGDGDGGDDDNSNGDGDDDNGGSDEDEEDASGNNSEDIIIEL